MDRLGFLEALCDWLEENLTAAPFVEFLEEEHGFFFIVFGSQNFLSI